MQLTQFRNYILFKPVAPRTGPPLIVGGFYVGQFCFACFNACQPQNFSHGI
jgi:hypothetical protein